MEGKIISVNSSKEKGVSKKNINLGVLRKNFGLVGDAHSGTNREVSLLGWERVQNWLRTKSPASPKESDTRPLRSHRTGGINSEQKIKPGDFAENITTEGIDWNKVKIGTRISILPLSPITYHRSPILLEVTEIGKECHLGCVIRKLVGDCLMPKEGVFAKVIQGGKIKVGDKIQIIADDR